MASNRQVDSFHVLLVLENYWPNIGGVENLFKSLAERLSSQGHRVTIITTRLSRSDPREEVIGNQRILRYGFRNRYLFTFLALFPVWKHARHCDLVHTTSYNAALPAFMGARLSQKKVIVTFHEVWRNLWFRLPFMSQVGKWADYLFEQWLLRLPFDRFIGVSESTSGNLRLNGVPEKRIVTLYNGIDYQAFGEKWARNRKPEDPGFTFTYFGRLGISKGLDILLEAARNFLHRYPDSRLKLIVPKEPAGFLSWLKKDIHEKGLDAQVDLYHHLSFGQLKEQLLTSDCVAIPSLSEGFCFAAVESIALGVPVISSDQAALKEVVSGQFIKMRTPDAAGLEDALVKARNGQWDSSPIRKFRLSDTVEGYLALYEEVSGRELLSKQMSQT